MRVEHLPTSFDECLVTIERASFGKPQYLQFGAMLADLVQYRQAIDAVIANNAITKPGQKGASRDA